MQQIIVLAALLALASSTSAFVPPECMTMCSAQVGVCAVDSGCGSSLTCFLGSTPTDFMTEAFGCATGACGAYDAAADRFANEDSAACDLYSGAASCLVFCLNGGGAPSNSGSGSGGDPNSNPDQNDGSGDDSNGDGDGGSKDDGTTLPPVTTASSDKDDSESQDNGGDKQECDVTDNNIVLRAFATYNAACPVDESTCHCEDENEPETECVYRRFLMYLTYINSLATGSDKAQSSVEALSDRFRMQACEFCNSSLLVDFGCEHVLPFSQSVGAVGSATTSVALVGGVAVLAVAITLIAVIATKSYTKKKQAKSRVSDTMSAPLVDDFPAISRQSSTVSRISVKAWPEAAEV